MPVSTRVSGGGVALAGNALFGGLIGAGIDVASGAMKDHFPNPVALALTPADGKTPPPPQMAPQVPVAAAPAPGPTVVAASAGMSLVVESLT